MGFMSHGIQRKLLTMADLPLKQAQSTSLDMEMVVAIADTPEPKMAEL